MKLILDGIKGANRMLKIIPNTTAREAIIAVSQRKMDDT
jgi:hypothetical protein